MPLSDVHFAGFHGAVRREHPEFTTRYRTLSHHNLADRGESISQEQCSLGVATQYLSGCIDEKVTERIEGPRHLLLRGVIPSMDGEAPATSEDAADWAARLRLLAASLDQGRPDTFATWEGDFVLCYYSSQTNQVYIYRSLTSTKFVYYRLDEEKFSWSTNPLHLLGHEHDPIAEVDTELLPVLLTLGCFDPTCSCYRDLRRLPAGHLLTLDSRGCMVRQITDFIPMDIGRISIPEATEAARGFVLASARRILAPKQKVGVLLSGGMDSAAVAYAAQAAGADVMAFHFSAAGYDPANEQPFADAIARHLHIDQVNIPIAKDYEAGSSYLDSAWRFPLPYNHAFYSWFERAAKMAAEIGVDTVLTGNFGDLVFGGSTVPDMCSLLANMPLRTTWTYTREMLGTYIPLKKVIRESYGTSQQRFMRQTSPPQSPGATCILTPWARSAARENGQYRFESDLPNAIARKVYHGAKRALEVVETPAVEMAALAPRGIEYSHIFADRTLINFGLGLPPGYRWFPYGGQVYEKVILRAAFTALLPPEIIRRNFRSYYGAIEETYCRNNSGFIACLLGRDAYLSQLNVIDPQAVTKALNNPADFPTAASYLIIAAMVELWLRSLAGKGANGCH